MAPPYLRKKIFAILFNSLLNTNDPLEFENYFLTIIHDIGVPHSEVNKLFEKSKEVNRIVKQCTKLSCFSMDKKYSDYIDPVLYFHKGFCKSRMWSQYADKHRGVCLIFNLEKMNEYINRGIDDIDGPIGSPIRIYFGEVKYDNKLHDLKKALTLDYNKYKEIVPLDIVHSHVKDYLFTKILDYVDEQEYRFCLYSDTFKKDESFLIDYADSLEGIILGYNFPGVYMINIRELAKLNRIPVFKMTWFIG